ncbi:MAG: type II secretion system GspH family protein, partial [Lentisphaeraceae bacterium]|nr:type II secretion system GspH family protein [Lentisphaeraceae bacterium]
MLNLNKSQAKKFTLIELLVVVTIFSILLTILLPTLHKARSKAQVMVCKSNMKQVGINIHLYMSSNSLIHPLPFQSGTGDHPSEGKPYAKGTLFPGNAAIYTSDYFESEETMVATFFCPLVDTDGERFNISPAPGGSWKKGDGLWSTYVYLYGKSLAGNDPYFEKRQQQNFAVNFISSVNEIS